MPLHHVVCIIDDDEALRSGVIALFRSARLEVRDFASAEAFLEALPVEGLACVVTDLRMPPGMGGLELWAELLGAGIKVPLILMSAYLTPQVVDTAVSLGVAAVLEKPVDPDLLLERLFAVLPAGG